MYSFCSPMILSSSTVWKVNRCSTRQPFVVLTFRSCKTFEKLSNHVLANMISSIASHNNMPPMLETKPKVGYLPLQAELALSGPQAMQSFDPSNSWGLG